MATEDDSDVPESGAVFTFGKTKFAENVPSKFWIRNDRVVAVSCGDEHTALVADSGRIFTFGSNDWGQLGLGHQNPATKPSCIKSLKKEKVKLAGCGRCFTLVATESGKLYSFGANAENQLGFATEGPSSSIPKLIDLPEQGYKKLCGGTDHSMVLTDNGKVYVWGGGSEGQLGLGEDETEVEAPRKLEFDDEVICISCGYYHSAVVTKNGKLYTFGEVDGGKLGIEDESNHMTPQEVPLPEKVIWVACGGSHTVAITVDGRVYTFGDGANGQLGLGNMNLQMGKPKAIPYLKGIKIQSAACGESHTALISDKGHLFTFGDGRYGKLALGEENFANQFMPSQVTRFKKFEVEEISCGGCHMLVMASPRPESEDWGSDEDEGVGMTDEGDGQNSVILNGKQETGLRINGLDYLRNSHDADLTGSFSARNRRREKQDPLQASFNRTLPTLNNTFSTPRALPALAAPTQPVPAKRSPNALNKDALSPIRKEEAEMNNSANPQLHNDNHLDNDRVRGHIKNDTEINKKPQPKPRPRQRPPLLSKISDGDEPENEEVSESISSEEDDGNAGKKSSKNKTDLNDTDKEIDDYDDESPKDQPVVAKKEPTAQGDATYFMSKPKKLAPLRGKKEPMPKVANEDTEEEFEEEEEDEILEKKRRAKLKEKRKKQGQKQKKHSMRKSDTEEDDEELEKEIPKKNAKKKVMFGKSKDKCDEKQEDTEESEEELTKKEKKQKKKATQERQRKKEEPTIQPQDSEEDVAEEPGKKKEKKKTKEDEKQDGEADSLEDDNENQTKKPDAKKTKFCVIL